jgi:hypothetical protein
MLCSFVFRVAENIINRLYFVGERERTFVRRLYLEAICSFYCFPSFWKLGLSVYSAVVIFPNSFSGSYFRQRFLRKNQYDLLGEFW